MKRLLILVPLAFFLAQSLFADEKATVRLLVTSDMHGWISTSLVHPRQKPAGLSHLADKIREIRKKDPGSILIDGGDTLQGSPLVHYYNHRSTDPKKENPFFKLMLSLNYDLAVVGNHDLQINPHFEEEYVKNSNFPWLAANLYREGKLVFRPYEIFLRKDQTIAVIGFTTPGSMMWLGEKQLRGIQIESISTSARKWLKILKEKENPDWIIGVFHSGLNQLKDDEISKLNRIPPANAVKKTLAQNEDFDLAINGHDHVLYPGKTGSKLRYINKTPVISAGHWAEALIDIKIFGNKKKSASDTKIKVEVFKPKRNKHLRENYIKSLPKDYLDYIFAKLPYRYENGSDEMAGLCVNLLSAMAVDHPGIQGSLLPLIKARNTKSLKGKTLRRLDLFKWVLYDNQTVKVRLSQRDIHLLKNPKPEFGRRKIPANRVLFPWFKDKGNGNPFIDSSGGIQDFKRIYPVLISDYHFNGGAGIISPLFLSPGDRLDSSGDFIRDRLFAYLDQNTEPLPKECAFLKKTD
ncbi:MAG: metallophosphoesterase [Deltaproteobacteria bacterium]|nr:metallophosphoesterase [Deltaproteobacteria bacterium]